MVEVPGAGGGNGGCTQDGVEGWGAVRWELEVASCRRAPEPSCTCGLAAEGSGEVDECSEGAAREKKRGGDAGGRSCEGGQWTREGRYVV